MKFINCVNFNSGPESMNIKKVLVRGNVVCASTGRGLKNVLIDVPETSISSGINKKTGQYGLFILELDNNVESRKIIIRHKNYHPFEHLIPQNLTSVYIPVVLKPKSL